MKTASPQRSFGRLFQNLRVEQLEPSQILDSFDRPSPSCGSRSPSSLPERGAIATPHNERSPLAFRVCAIALLPSTSRSPKGPQTVGDRSSYLPTCDRPPAFIGFAIAPRLQNLCDRHSSPTRPLKHSGLARLRDPRSTLKFSVRSPKPLIEHDQDY
jgi:hypothetical protein